MQPISPPKAEVDDSPLHNAMDKNKESLKVKLMLRRPINQLVAQGIMPPLKTPPGFHEQRQKLERAKMGDLLKAKIQQRPDRQELVRQHILEDVGHVDPSLAEKQRQLKKCRLADSLNDQLSHRPGPLELIKKNILHTDEPIERAVKEGHIEFKATSEGHSTKPTPPDHYMLDEDSSSGSSPSRDTAGTGLISEGVPLLTGLANGPGLAVVPAASVASTSSSPLSGVTAPTPAVTAAQPAAKGSIVTVLLTPATTITLPYAPPAPPPAPSPSTSASTGSAPSTPRPSPAPGKDKNRKKSKAKALPKARTIKFHEYKGPPNAQKSSSQSSSSTPAETSYEILLQQQQLFLQWQLEWQNKYPHRIPPSQKPPSDTSPSPVAVTSPAAPPPPPMPQSPPPGPTPPLRNLEDMKVSDLKAELKRRNLPVSGAKPQLIERLKPFSESAQSQSLANNNSCVTQSSTVSSSSSNPILEDTATNGALSVSSVDVDVNSPMAPGTPPSPAQQGSMTSLSSSSVTSTQNSSVVAMDIGEANEGVLSVGDQKRKIDQLQRQLMTSQIQLQKTFQQQKPQIQNSRRVDHSGTNAKANLAAFLQQQQLNQAMLQQQQDAAVNNNNNNLVSVGGNVMSNCPTLKQRSSTEQTLLNHLNHRASHQRTGSLPNFETLLNGQADVSPADVNGFVDNKIIFKNEIKVEPEEIKSQIVDDVLEILIKNGELPASAAEMGMNLENEFMGPPLDGMEVDQDLMDVDTDWLESFMVDSGQHTNGGMLTSTVISRGAEVSSVGLSTSGVHRPCGDPLLAPLASSPEPAFMDLFMDETDLKIPQTEFVWDRIDFST